MRTVEYARAVESEDAVRAQGAVVAFATVEGFRVRTVKSVSLQRQGDMEGRLPEYLVRLAVDPRPVSGCDCE